MEDTADPVATIDTVAKITEKTALFLDSLGVELPLFTLQIIAVVAICAVLIPIILSAWNKTGTQRYIMLSLALPLVAIFAMILVYWIAQARSTPTDYIAGRIHAKDTHDMWMELLDLRGRAMVAGPKNVDSSNGGFGLTFTAGFGDRPRRVRIHKDGCRTKEYDISVSQLRAGQKIDLQFQCEAI